MVTLGQKLKMQKKHVKIVFTRHCSCSMQETAPKNSLYLKNETILKISKNGHQAKAIAFANECRTFSSSSTAEDMNE